MTESRLRELLRDASVPDARAAEERGWRVVRGGVRGPSDPVHVPPRVNRLAIAVASALLLSRSALARRRQGGRPRARRRSPGSRRTPARRSPRCRLGPSAGHLPEGSWVVAEDGSQRLLGAYERRSLVAPRPVRRRRPGAGAHRASTRRERCAGRWRRDHPVSDPAWSPSGSGSPTGRGLAPRGGRRWDRRSSLVARVALHTRRYGVPCAGGPAPQVIIGRWSMARPAGRAVGCGRGTSTRGGCSWRIRRGAAPIRGLHWSTTGHGYWSSGPTRSFDVPRLARPTESGNDRRDARPRPSSQRQADRFVRRPRRTPRERADRSWATGRPGPPSASGSLPGRGGSPSLLVSRRRVVPVRRPDADQWLFIRPSSAVLAMVEHLAPVRPRRQRPRRLPRVAAGAAAALIGRRRSRLIPGHPWWWARTRSTSAAFRGP